VKYYRYFRFFNTGEVLYALDITAPDEMGKVLKNGEPVPKKVYFGRYQLKKNMITVHIFLHYCTMIFELALLDQSECYFRSGCSGKFNYL
jgi:hypothetical protein